MTYDSFGNMLSVKVGSKALASYVYGAKNGMLTRQTYGNGDTVSFTYDNLGRVKTTTYDDGRVLTYTYNGDGQLHSLAETGGPVDLTTWYFYDDLGRLVASEQKSGDTVLMQTGQGYNEYNQMTVQAWRFSDTAYAEQYTYNEQDGSLASMTTALGQTLNLSYDSLRRLSSVSLGSLSRQYLYRDLSSTQTTTQVATVRYPVPGTSQNYDFNYTYDTLGNVTSCSLPDGTVLNATYDDQGQLLTVTGTGINFSYTYDNVGNILTASENGTNHTYTYGNSNWKDLLTAYDGKMIVYDTSGNPVSYYNGTRWSLSWRNGRSLTAASSGSTGISFTYDAGGMRTSKTVGTLTSIYFYASGKLLREIRYNSADQTTAVLDFFYAYDGTPYAMKYNGTVYYFLTNLQGDVMMILDASGSLAGGYVYDPYGKVLSATGTIAQINPIRYRGYYHDTETGFYYLQSRYYDPEIGRFINADGYASTGQGVIGHNMFAYCNNNPINCIDIWGDFPVAATIIIGSGAIVGGISGALSASSTGGNVGTGIFKGILTGTAGAVCGLYSTPFIGLASGTVIDLGTQVISQLAETGELDISQINILAAANTGISTAAGVLVPVWGDAVESIGAALGTSLIFAEASMIITATEIAATNSNIKPKSSNTTKKTTYTPKYPINSVPLKATQDKYKIPSYKTSVGTSYTPEMKKKLTVMERRLAG